MESPEQLEPWLRGTHTEIQPMQRAVVHALELAREDVVQWAGGLSAQQLGMQPHGLPSVAFQMRHIARSLDRLLTYAEGRGLSEPQFAALKAEAAPELDTESLHAEFVTAVDVAIARVLQFYPENFADVRGVGRAGLPTTVAGLLIHVAEHTQRHVGQAITTAKVVIALSDSEQS